MGQIQDGTFTDSQTIAYYEKCIEIGMTMNNEERQQSSLAYIATLLLKKYGNSKKGRRTLQTNGAIFRCRLAN